MRKVKAALLGYILLATLADLSNGALEVGFYRGKCGIADVEMIVAGVVTARSLADPTILAALIRLHYHDCFVNGCDASILIDGINSEKAATPNLGIRGYDVIDEAKDAVDRACPGVVSCADLIAIAARDAVFLSGGSRYEVQTGRRDGLVSSAQNVAQFIPAPSTSVYEAVTLFANKGLNPTDMVLLIGAHSIGVAHCSFFNDRLYNFQNTGRPDPTMDPFFANELRFQCPPDTTTINNTVNLDQNLLRLLDNSYYKQLMMNRGILQIDQELAMHPATRATVMNLANGLDFPTMFGEAMVRLGAIEVLTGWQGQIRRSCRAINWPPFT